MSPEINFYGQIPFFFKVLLRIEKILTVFLIFNKIFSKTDLLMYALSGPFIYIYIYIYIGMI